ncbi:MAG TPA: hypothetical protein VI911_11425 [Patescibacteria group bacterium]|nr:hypothetical protein [Patescibacteria group bacterium]
MTQSVTMKGVDIKLYIGGKVYPCAQEIRYTIDYGESEIYGIDSAFPMEIVTTKVSIQGTISGVKLKSVGGLQGYDLRTKIQDILHAPYVSLRIKDRHTDSDILWIPQMKVTSEQLQVVAKGVVKLSFNFKGIIPYNELDLH